MFSCNENKEMGNNRLTARNLQEIDQHSFAKPKEAVITHLKWEATIDFENKTIQAIAQYKIQKFPNANEIILDTKNLDIEKIWGNENDIIQFKIEEQDEVLGQALHIPLSKDTKTISIQYKTPANAEALQWLNAQQTVGNSPFLFTQSQAILCRSWIPIQDSPGIRFTFEAEVKVPEGNLALMSAENPQELDSTGHYSFKMGTAHSCLFDGFSCWRIGVS